MEPFTITGLALFTAPAAIYGFARDAQRTREVVTNGGAFWPHQGRAELPALDVTPTAEELTELLRRCANADRAAFRRLYELQTPRLYAIALRITRQPALAADAVHDALLQVWQNARRYDPSRGNPEAWLLSLVRYRALDIARRQARETTGLELPDSIDEDPDALNRMIGTAEGEALQRCLQTLPAERRRLVVMAFIEGLSHSELSQRLGQPLGTVKSWIRRALLTLKRCLDHE